MKKSMKNKLRIRFVLLAMLGLLIMQTVIVTISIYYNYRDMVEKSDMLITQLHNKQSGSIRYFSVKIPAGTDTVYPDVVQYVSVTADEATVFARKALSSNREKGFTDGYRYHIYRNENGIRIYFLSRSASMEMCRVAGENLIWISIIGLVVIGVLLIPISGWVVEPLVENHRKQKEFITAASHELKTPLTVISTNAQLLEMEIGRSDWLDGIQKQVAHLTQMTRGLVMLSKAEEYNNPLVRASFSFSDALRDVIETYEVIAKHKNIHMEHSVATKLVYSGDKDEIQQLLRILLDNACKYCPKEGSVYIRVKGTPHGVKLCVSNTSEPVKEGNGKISIIRFSRGKNAAGITGFGLGLSIAEAIAKRHNGSLTVSTEADKEFSVEVVLN